ncbi:MAG: hypothetical protein SVV80_07180 [Planctomycetota bacterium]|nr:hypothetical protein [Planctomycetota bacterium]
MTKESEWTKEVYETSVSSRCWWYTPYGAGWDRCRRNGADISTDDELRQIVAMERQLGSVPHWAQQIVERSINFLPPCGHYLFPQPYMEAVGATGSQKPPVFLHSCYTADSQRKERMVDYVLCLDAWLAGASPELPARELSGRDRKNADWNVVCGDLWGILGEHTQLKELLVERTIHQLRWWVKSLIWDNDARDVFCRDRFLGEVCCEGDCYGNAAFSDPYFTELRSQRAGRMEAQISDLCLNSKWFLDAIHHSWLCAPKAFRFLERLIWAIGKERPPGDADEIPGFLRCEDTYPNQDKTAQWWRSFVAALKGWQCEKYEHGDVADKVNDLLGQPNPVKCWLVRLFIRKLERLEMNKELAGLVNPLPGNKRGTKPHTI